MVGARWVRGREEGREGVTTSWWELGGWVGGRVCDYVMMGARWVGGRGCDYVMVGGGWEGRGCAIYYRLDLLVVSKFGF